MNKNFNFATCGNLRAAKRLELILYMFHVSSIEELSSILGLEDTLVLESIQEDEDNYEIPFDLANKIFIHLPKLNWEWIFEGRGRIFRKESLNHTIIPIYSKITGDYLERHPDTFYYMPRTEFMEGNFIATINNCYTNPEIKGGAILLLKTELIPEIDMPYYVVRANEYQIGYLKYANGNKWIFRTAKDDIMKITVGDPDILVFRIHSGILKYSYLYDSDPGRILDKA